MSDNTNINIDAIINQLLVSPIAEVVQVAERAKAFKTQLDASVITLSEFKELITDLQHLDHINKNMIEVERWREIVQAVEVLNMIRQWAPLL
jgi:hypothetical protein